MITLPANRCLVTFGDFELKIKTMSGAEARPFVDSLYERNGKKHRARDADIFFVAFDGDQAVGTVRFCVENGAALLRSMQVDQGYQRKGIGIKLLEQFEAYLKDKKIRSVFCLPYAHLEGFYGQIGFRHIRAAEAPEFLHERMLQYKTIYPQNQYMLMKRP